MAELLHSGFSTVVGDHSVRSVIANEILTARRLIETLGAELCRDPAITARHGEALQQLDLAAQLIEQAARLLRMEGDMARALDAVTLEAMRARIASALAIADHDPAPAVAQEDEFW
ncbi:hypothetical protein [Sphingomonas quercus]|uniref:Uncharacterized protein n=1 Tax=Sphingomonas quercus TaxID=2842451 RepID=A0ABS6BDW9_9SPHN|nr:hypothetical protein [Sphingomonas quercus]MBU3076516.1 hypothetical protein [Sphingomonas quercus]